MMKRYIDILSSCGADAWEITDTKTYGWEFYFIKHRLDQNRAKDVEHITLKVYKLSEDGQSLGIASCEVAPTESDEYLKKTASDLVYKASLVKNRPYRLNQPKEAEPLKITTSTVEVEASKYLKVMSSIAETESEYLNSYEIFVDRNESRLITSEGIDITETGISSRLEVVVNARKAGHEIELYRLYSMGGCDEKQVKADIEELLKIGRDRLRTVPTPNLNETAIVLSTDAALSVYEYFLDNMDASFVVRGMSSFEIGKPLAADSGSGDMITLSAVRFLPGSPDNFAYDREGAPIRDEVLIENGVPARYTGSRMFSQYLGLEDSFIVSNWSVSGGSCSAEELRSGRFLEIVEFSDFQVDSITGDIFGEIRLAYLHDGEENITPVSGGSVSGSLRDNLDSMKMSKETRRFSNAQIPCVTRLEKVTVAGE